MIITANMGTPAASATPTAAATGLPQTAQTSDAAGGRQAPQDVVSLSRAAQQMTQGGDRDNDGDSH